MKIAYQAVKGLCSHKALEQFHGEKIPLAAFSDVYKAIFCAKVDQAENALIETTYQMINLLAGGGLKIVTNKADHCPTQLLRIKIKNILSYPKALERCKKLLNEHPEWELIPHDNTPEALFDAAKLGNLTLGTIASKITTKPQHKTFRIL